MNGVCVICDFCGKERQYTDCRYMEQVRALSTASGWYHQEDILTVRLGEYATGYKILSVCPDCQKNPPWSPQEGLKRRPK